MFIMLRSFYIACLNNNFFFLSVCHHQVDQLSLILQPYNIQCYAFAVQDIVYFYKISMYMTTIVVE